MAAGRLCAVLCAALFSSGSASFSEGVFWSKVPALFGSARYFSFPAQALQNVEVLLLLDNGPLVAGFDDYPEAQKAVRVAASSATVYFPGPVPAVAASNGGQSVTVGSVDEAMALIQSNLHLGDNGKCDTIMIKAADPGGAPRHEVDRKFQHLASLVHQLTRGRSAVALLTTPPASGEEDTSPSDYVKTMTLGTRRLASSSGPPTNLKFVQMTPDLLAGILTGILMAFVILIGLSCLNAIQTPSIFTDKPPPSSKEY